LPQHKRRWLPWALALLVCLNAAALAWLLLRQTPAPPPAATAVADPAPISQNAPALAELTGRPDTLAPPPVAAPQPIQPASPPPPRVEPDAPLLSSMSDSFRRALPELGINVHVYAEQPSARFVMIDGRSYREGQTVADGLILEHITRDGVILSHRGQYFRVLR
jgi:general secretion pathway protein B